MGEGLILLVQEGTFVPYLGNDSLRKFVVSKPSTHFVELATESPAKHYSFLTDWCIIFF